MSLNEFMSCIAESGKQRREKIDRWIEKLGPPHYIVETPPEEGFHYLTGLWRVADGVIIMTRNVRPDGTKSNWSYDSRREIDEQLFQAIRRLKGE